MHFSIAIGVHLQARLGISGGSREGGFIAEHRMDESAGMSLSAARLIVTRPSSNGCRSDSRLLRLNSGSSVEESAS